MFHRPEPRESHVLLNISIQWALEDGRCHRGQPRKRWRYDLDAHRESCSVTTHQCMGTILNAYKQLSHFSMLQFLMPLVSDVYKTVLKTIKMLIPGPTMYTQSLLKGLRLCNGMGCKTPAYIRRTMTYIPGVFTVANPILNSVY